MPTPNPYIDKVNYNNDVYDIYDSAHGTLTNSEITTGTDTTPKFVTAKVIADALGSGGSVAITASNHILEIDTSISSGDGVRY